MPSDMLPAHRVVPPRTRLLARTQRREPTRAEEMLWRDLRDRRLFGHKFRRQVPVGVYVVDFICPEARLVVELDGKVHADPEQQAHDRARDAWLASQNFRVLRFSNDLILSGSGELVLDEIRRTLSDPADPSSDPATPGHLLPQGEKGSRAGAQRRTMRRRSIP